MTSGTSQSYKHLTFQLIYESRTGNFILLQRQTPRYFLYGLYHPISTAQLILGVSWLCPPALRLSGFQHDQGSAAQPCSTDGNASGEQCQLCLALCPPGLCSWAPERLGCEVRLPNSPTPTSSVTSPKRSVSHCAVSLHMDAFCTRTGLKGLPYSAGDRLVGSGGCSMFMILFKSNLNPSLLRPDSQNQKLPLEIFLCKTRI